MEKIEVVLPTLDKASELLEARYGMYTFASVQAFREDVERQLRSALTQIAALTKQVENQRRRINNLDKILFTYNANGVVDADAMAIKFLESTETVSKLEAELAALREGATEVEPFLNGERVIVNHPRYQGKGIVQYDTGNRQRMIGVLLGNGNTWEYEVGTVTREHILDEKEEPTYPCAKCGKLRTKDQGGTTFTVCDACWGDEKGEG